MLIIHLSFKLDLWLVNTDEADYLKYNDDLNSSGHGRVVVQASQLQHCNPSHKYSSLYIIILHRCISRFPPKITYDS